MEIYIKVSFWLGLLGVGVNMIMLLVGKFPKKHEVTLGETLFKILVGVGFAVWAGIILYT